MIEKIYEKLADKECLIIERDQEGYYLVVENDKGKAKIRKIKLENGK